MKFKLFYKYFCDKQKIEKKSPILKANHLFIIKRYKMNTVLKKKRAFNFLSINAIVFVFERKQF